MTSPARGPDGSRPAGYAVTNQSAIEGNFFHFPTRSTSTSVNSSGRIGSADLIVPCPDANTNVEHGAEISFAPFPASGKPYRVDVLKSLPVWASVKKGYATTAQEELPTAAGRNADPAVDLPQGFLWRERR